MKKKSIVKLFFASLLKSILCIVVILGVGVASYKISYSLLSDAEGKGSDITDSLKEIIDEATTDEISKNLIYVSDDKNKITHVMLEICNTKTYNMDYVTIPVQTDYTIPSVMYRKLCQVNQEIPQVIRISKLKQYFSDENDAYGYGILIFEKMLGTDISYYTAIDQKTYKSHYVQKNVKVAYQTKSSGGNTPGPDGTTPASNTTLQTKMKITLLSDSYKKQIKDLRHDKEKIADYIKEQYERVNSNLTEYNKIGYVEAYEKMDAELYHYWGIPGAYDEKTFEVDTKAAKKALKWLTENEKKYSTAQNLKKVNMITSSPSNNKAVANVKDNILTSKSLKIYVLNGSRIAGIASAKKQKLESAGYTVPEVGNYMDETLTTTRIKVRQAGMGEDLKKYFNKPEIVVGGVTKGYDIEIIVGTMDAD